MRPRILLIPAICFLALNPVIANDPAQWIWSDDPRNDSEQIALTHTFEIKTIPERATLRAIGDFCRFELRLNGQRAATREAYDDHCELDIGGLLKQGANKIEVIAQGISGPSAIAVQIDGFFKGESRTLLTSDSNWVVGSAASDDKGKPAASFGLLRALRWREPDALPAIGAFDEYNQWKEALGAAGEKARATFSKLPGGFEIELVRSAKDDEGSWVSMAFDPKGRIILAREKRGLLRATLSKDAKSITRVEVINDTLLECRGLLFAHGNLYANANNSKALHRLRDTDDDDTFDEVTLLKETGGSVGHGRNDLALGPDGMVYAIHGDSVQIPKDAEFRTPPTVGSFRHEGHLVRTDADGKAWEIVATGLRNPFGIDFNPDGEPFTYDADNESDIGLPFYRPTRVNHLFSGADFGWRQGGRSWPVYAPDSQPTTCDIGHGSPTAVKFGTRSHFPNRYRNALFILDWAYGRIIAVDTIPRGASYTCRAHTFLRGRPLNVTDLGFGPDGAMYFVTGGRKTRSALYRVRYTGPTGQPVALTEQENARTEYSAKARELRKSFENLHRTASPDAPDTIWPELDNPDPWIRHAARTALEHQPVSRWQKIALTQSPPDSETITALLALARVGDDETLPKIIPRLLETNLLNLRRAEQSSILRTYEICRRRKCPLDGRTTQNIISQLVPAFPSQHPELNRELARMLVDLGAPEAIQRSLQQLAAVDTQLDQLFYLDILSRAAENEGWTLDRRESFFRFLKTAQTFTGDRSLPGFIKGIRDRAIAATTPIDQVTLSHVIEWKSDREPAPDPASSGRKVVKNWSLADLSEILETSDEDDSASVARGEKIFTAALCSRCHQIGTIGTPAAPNLTAVSSRFSRRDILASIIDPSSVVAEIYQNHVVTKKDGTVVIGRLIKNNLRESTFTMAPNPFAPWETETVSKMDIAKREISPASPMPAGLLNTFSLAEIRDLVSFIETVGVHPE